MVTTATSLYAASTEQSADSIEAHPTHPGLFALGTYQITQHPDEHVKTAAAAADDDDDDEPNGTTGPPISRKGTVRLMQSRTLADGRSVDCATLATLDTAAVLDMKWLSDRGSSMLAVARADSMLSLYRLEQDVDTHSLVDATHTRINDRGALCLSLDWSPSASIVSQSDGTLAHITSIEAAQSNIDSIATWNAHDYEAWIAAFDRTGNVVWSGGDDLALKGWDVRTPCHEDDDGGDARQPTFTHKRSFEGGVTAIQCHAEREHLWAVGSYDAQLRLFDARNTARPVAQIDVGGGVWRVKWHPRKSNTLLVGCMHDGFKVLDIDNTDSTPSILLGTRFDEHKSLAYGCDWDRGRATTNSASPDYIYSCSFYDAMLHAWSA